MHARIERAFGMAGSTFAVLLIIFAIMGNVTGSAYFDRDIPLDHASLAIDGPAHPGGRIILTLRADRIRHCAPGLSSVRMTAGHAKIDAGIVRWDVPAGSGPLTATRSLALPDASPGEWLMCVTIANQCGPIFLPAITQDVCGSISVLPRPVGAARVSAILSGAAAQP
jgi:hypothetical protein